MARAGNVPARSKAVSIDRWYAAQDKAVEGEFRRLQRARRDVAPAEVNQPGNEYDVALAGALRCFETTESVRRELIAAGHSPDTLQQLVNNGQALNRYLVGLFERGCFSEKYCPTARHHRIVLVKEIVDGELVSRLYINGMSTFWSPEACE